MYQEGVIQPSTHFLDSFSNQIKQENETSGSVDSKKWNAFIFKGFFFIITKNKWCPGYPSRCILLIYSVFKNGEVLSPLFPPITPETSVWTTVIIKLDQHSRSESCCPTVIRGHSKIQVLSRCLLVVPRPCKHQQIAVLFHSSQTLG